MYIYIYLYIYILYYRYIVFDFQSLAGMPGMMGPVDDGFHSFRLELSHWTGFVSWKSWYQLGHETNMVMEMGIMNWILFRMIWT